MVKETLAGAAADASSPSNVEIGTPAVFLSGCDAGTPALLAGVGADHFVPVWAIGQVRMRAPLWARAKALLQARTFCLPDSPRREGPSP